MTATMDFDLEDGLGFVRSLTNKVKSIIDKIRVSPTKGTDHMTENARAYYPVTATPFADDISINDEDSLPHFCSGPLPKYLRRKTENSNLESDKAGRKGTSPAGVLDMSKDTKQSLNVNCEAVGNYWSSYPESAFQELDASCNSKCNFNVTEDLLGLSSSFSMHILNKSKAKLLDQGLGLSESLRKLYLNSPNTPDCPDYPLEQFTRRMSLTSYKALPTHKMAMFDIHPETFRAGIDSDNGGSLDSSNFSACDRDSSNCRSSLATNSSSHSGLEIGNSDFSEFSSDTDVELVKIRYDTSSSVDNTSYSVNETEPLDETKSFTEEFKHDIDFLAKSTYRTSTPDQESIESATSPSKFVTSPAKFAASPPKSVARRRNFVSGRTESIAPSNLSDGEIWVTNQNENEKVERYSRHPSLSVTDTLASVPVKQFVHGLSPLCHGYVSTNGSQSYSRMRVRRSLVFVSPSKSVVMFPKDAAENSPVASTENHASLSYFNNISGLTKRKDKSLDERTVFPKVMFRDETEEAVFYLITKYLENSNCKW